MISNEERLIAVGSPFELIQGELDGIPCRLFRHAPASLIDLYARALRCGEQDLLVCGSRRFSYREVFSRARHICRILVDTFGVRAGSRVAVILDNSPEWIIGFVAVGLAGATAVAIHKRASPVQMLTALEIARCTLIVCDDAVARSLLEHGTNLRMILVRSSPCESIRATVIPFLGAHIDAQVGAGELSSARPDVRPDDLALIAFTSGSTGQPKGVELTHRSLMHGMMNMLLGGALMSLRVRRSTQNTRPARPISLLVAPFSHVAGFCNILLAMHLGSTVTTMEGWNPDTAMQVIRAAPAISLVGATSEMIRDLLRGGTAGGAESLGAVTVQGTALSPGLVSGIKALFPQASPGTGYGMTETSGSVCVSSAAPVEECPTTCGQPLPSVDLRIQRADGTEAGRGETGEVVVRGAMVMRGYCNSPEATGKVLHQGWLRTGDLGHLDSDGFLHVDDRASNIFVCNGVEVSCAEVERVILDSSLARDAAAVVIEDTGHGARLAVAIACSDGCAVDESRIVHALVSAGYTDAAQPHIVRLDSLPRTVSGKVDRREVRQRILANVRI